jgi:argininosuccinate lyase
MKDQADTKLWGGRFSESTDAFVEAFTASIQFDQRLYKQDIRGSKAHAKMLQKVGLLTAKELQDIQRGLDEILAELNKGK